MNEKYVIANWKMNPDTQKEAKKIIQDLKKNLSKEKIKNTNIVIAPPAIYFSAIQSLKIKKFILCAQNISIKDTTSRTGEHSINMFSSFGVKYAIVGHSDLRRSIDDLSSVNKKVQACLKNGIRPILCIGENEKDNNGFYLKNISDQIISALSGVSKKEVENIVFVYEPVWAISNSMQRDATGEEVGEAVMFMRKILSDLYEAKTVKDIPILYGGSVDETSVSEYLEKTDVSGFLVGRASLSPEKFSKIVIQTEKNKK